MKKIIFLLLLAATNAFAQEDAPINITPAIAERIQKQVNEQALVFEKTLINDGYMKAAIEFMVDTFKINSTMQRSMDINYSTYGMNDAMEKAAVAYDILLNKYYNNILNILKTEDKKILVQAQKAWLTFKDAEKKLISVLGKEAYSGGGTIQSNIASASYLDLLQARVAALFEAYDVCVALKN